MVRDSQRPTVMDGRVAFALEMMSSYVVTRNSAQHSDGFRTTRTFGSMDIQIRQALFIEYSFKGFKTGKATSSR